MDSNYFRYLNQKCPVCGKEFGENEDIVVCPLCGTPHHRDCYKKNGECGNAFKHNEGFRWEPEINTAAEPSAEENNQNFGGQPPFGQSPFGNAQQPPFGNAQQPFGQPPFTGFSPLSLFPPELDEGVSTEDAASFIQVNPIKYLDRFFHQKGGKRTWNWAAFLFTPLWFFYRKMPKLGSVFFAITFLVSAVCTYAPPALKLMNETAAVYETYVDSSEDEAAAFEKFSQSLAAVIKDNRAGIVFAAAQPVILIAVYIFAGAFANKWYYEHTVKTVRKIKSEIIEPDRQKLTLFRKGGTSLGLAVLAIMASQCGSMILSLILI